MPALPAFRPQTPALLYRRVGKTIYGDGVYAAPMPIKIAVLKMGDIQSQSPIRSEASGSHGRVDQDVGMTKILFQPTLSVSNYDRMDFFGTTMEVISIFPRYDNFGRLQHYLATLRIVVVMSS